MSRKDVGIGAKQDARSANGAQGVSPQNPPSPGKRGVPERASIDWNERLRGCLNSEHSAMRIGVKHLRWWPTAARLGRMRLDQRDRNEGEHDADECELFRSTQAVESPPHPHERDLKSPRSLPAAAETLREAALSAASRQESAELTAVIPAAKLVTQFHAELVALLHADRRTGELTGENTVAEKSCADFVEQMTLLLDAYGLSPDAVTGSRQLDLRSDGGG